MAIKENHAGWLLHTTLVGKDGKNIDQQCYQHGSSIDMLELLKDRKATKKEWESEKNHVVFYYLHLMQIVSYGSAGVLISTYVTEADLEEYAKHEQALIDAKKS
jgi:hypothetical protein